MPLSGCTAPAGAPHPKQGFRFLFFLGLIALLLAGESVRAAELRGVVVGVSDGDTITVLDRSRARHKIRLSGIDAPERRQAYGERAKQRLAALVLHREVIVTWQKHDRYGRIVGRVLAPGCANPPCAEMLDAGLALISAGLAWHYKQYQKEQEAGDRQRYAAAEQDARSTHLGLWRDADPVPPWQYRRRPARAHAGSSRPSL